MKCDGSYSECQPRRQHCQQDKCRWSFNFLVWSVLAHKWSLNTDRSMCVENIPLQRTHCRPEVLPCLGRPSNTEEVKVEFVQSLEHPCDARTEVKPIFGNPHAVVLQEYPTDIDTFRIAQIPCPPERVLRSRTKQSLASKRVGSLEEIRAIVLYSSTSSSNKSSDLESDPTWHLHIQSLSSSSVSNVSSNRDSSSEISLRSLRKRRTCSENFGFKRVTRSAAAGSTHSGPVVPKIPSASTTKRIAKIVKEDRSQSPFAYDSDITWHPDLDPDLFSEESNPQRRSTVSHFTLYTFFEVH